MRIIINEDDQKTKFYKMATIFAEEYNKYAPAGEKAHIVLPYSFLLSKVKHPFPESLPGVQNGDAEKKFIQLVNEKRHLFEFEFTGDDQALYSKAYSAASNLLGRYKASEREAASYAAAEDDAPLASAPTSAPLAPHVLGNLRNGTRYNDELLTMLGQNKNTWFSDRGIGEDHALTPIPSDHSLCGPGLFLAMLQSPDARKAMGIEIDKLPAITEATLPLYRDMYARACDLMDKVAAHANRQSMAAQQRRIETMSATRREKPPVSKGQMRMMAEDALKAADYLAPITAQWLEEHDIAHKENVLQYEIPAEGGRSKLSVSGSALLHAMLHSNSIRNLLVSDGEIKRASQLGMYALAKKEEPTLFVVDDEKFYDEYIKPKQAEHLRINPAEPTAEETLGASFPLRDVATAPLYERPRRRPRHTISGDFPMLDAPKPALFYANLKARLSELKKGHPEREASIDSALAAMHEEIQRSGHSNNGHNGHNGNSAALRILESAAPQPVDGAAHTTAATAIRAILDGGKSALDEKVVRHLDKAFRQADSIGRKNSRT